MREILFRAKAINRDLNRFYRSQYKNGEWVYGLLTKLYNEQFKNLPAEVTDIHGISGVEIDYKTIGQYTGLTDYYGEKIFEGDIIKCDDDIGEVSYDSKSARFIVVLDYVIYDFKDLSSYCIEVVGNIYDHPELL